MRVAPSAGDLVDVHIVVGGALVHTSTLLCESHAAGAERNTVPDAGVAQRVTFQADLEQNDNTMYTRTEVLLEEAFYEMGANICFTHSILSILLYSLT